MFESIYSCKLYRTSTRKRKIEATLDDPINSELVGQLAKALDEEYIRPEYLVKDYGKHEDNTDKNLDSDSNTVDNDDLGKDVGVSNHKFSNDSNLSFNDEPDNPMDTDTDSGESDSSIDDAQTNPEFIEQSTTAKGRFILGSQIREKFENMKQVADQIKGMLNFKDSTQGVSRILVKEDEFWIYYNDDINLNNVMDDVIELLNGSSYYYLEFNRLARSDNAIVFQIMFSDSYHGQKTSTDTK